MKQYMELTNKYRESIIRHSQQLVRIKSVESEPLPGMPFGEGVNQALVYMLQLARELGFETVNVDGYAGHADLGTGDEIVAVLVHLDVVPEGTGWEYPPYGGEIHDGKIYGRGIIDDKGPAVASLYAMKILADSGLPLQKKIRLIFGTDEESGWKDLEVYFKHYPRPKTGFSPDAEFPLIHGEKGIQIFDLKGRWKQDDADVVIEEIKGGNAPNMVPDSCCVKLAAAENLKSAMSESLLSFNRRTGFELIMEDLQEKVIIIAPGVSAHGSTPEKGKNAISHLLLFLAECPGLSEDVSRLIGFYNHHIGLEVNGKAMGCGYEDEISGKLVFNVGQVKGDQHEIEWTVNTRYPITIEGEQVLKGMAPILKRNNIELIMHEDVKPLYVPKEDELVQKLMQVYREATGDLTSEPFTIGGGTYARALENGVAFGPLFPGQEELAHQKNEFMKVDDLLRMTSLYAAALASLAG
ncbi:dipeptidase PepV [Anoxynatronum buryatiense]|uniref:Succinyl-diaminopimelate desuccinylase n=1 Tax=Anoxynatronum buryatiense TaxID=489973 RepID=A0AA46AHH7_9CLOT|nr:dipeptidase PepV [Anoxynatronum buryatiense]SMP39733.1 succinyl-diaminopimelate desuccinylase [Anoxynatronum buryatiense]